MRALHASAWVCAWALAVASPVMRLLRPDTAWWVLMLLVVPLIVLVVWRHERKNFVDHGHIGADGGAWW